MSHETTWLVEWASSPQPHAYGLLWTLDVLAGGIHSLVHSVAFCGRKAARGLARLVHGFIALFGLHVLQSQDWDLALGPVTGGVAVATVAVVTPLILSLLQNCGVLPKAANAP